MNLIKKTFYFSYAVFFLLTLLLVSIYLYAKSTPKIDIKLANNIVIYDNNNNIIFNGHQSKEWVSLNNISEYLINATLYTEDKRFYNHFGFDFKRILKSIYVNMINKSLIEGASTITQQYSRNLFLDFDKTWKRKFDEAMLSFKLETHYSKEEILEGYLNTINYGNGVLGIENASLYYFNKSAKDLNLAEATMLAGIPKSPNNFSPLNDELEAKKRQNIILTNMLNNNIISEEEKKEALEQNLVYHGIKDRLNLSTLLYYQDAVIKELKSIINTKSIEKRGLKIYTALDLEAQTILENNILYKMKEDLELQTAGIMMNPENGQIIALVGGRDYSKSEFNRATSSRRQVGSTMKPFLYYAALENGFTASTSFFSEPTIFTFSNKDTYSPRNFAEIYPNEEITMAIALSYSDNIYAVKTHLFLGEEVLVDISKRVGIKENLYPHPSLPLGTIEINIIDFITGYSTLANEGHKVEPHLIKKIVDSNDNLIYKANEKKEQVLNKSITFILNELLTTTYDLNLIDYSYPTCTNMARSMSRKYAVKSGSTDTDVWTIGYNKDVVLGIWNGYDDNTSISLDVSRMSKEIWINAIEEYLKDKESNWYTIPNNVVGILVNPFTGKIATENSEKKRILYYIKGTEPIDKD